MQIPVHPELPTAALRPSQATHAAVDNSAPSAIAPESTYKSGKAVQTNGATSANRQAGPVCVIHPAAEYHGGLTKQIADEHLL